MANCKIQRKLAIHHGQAQLPLDGPRTRVDWASNVGAKHSDLDDRPRELSRPPRRVFWKSPFRYRALSWGRSGTCVATTSGRLRRVTCWVPLEKVQSLRQVQGPVQRRLRLASVHVDTAGRSAHATLRDRDASEASRALGDLTDLARAARRRPALT